MSGHHLVLDDDGFPRVEGMRYNGFRWVSEDSLDTNRAVVAPPSGPGLDMFGGTGQRKPPRPKVKMRKTRRRGRF